MKSMLSRKKSTIIAVSAIGLLGFAVSVTLAVSHDRSVMSSKIKLAGYHTLFTETFDAPQNWKTCETIDKTITVTNDSDSSGAVAVRVKLEEQWLASDGVTELPLVSSASGLTMAQINFTANSGWIKKGSYYYYDADLATGATSTSLITGVTLNCDANLDTTATAAANSDGAYSDATYKLNITAQAIDAGSKDEWSTSLAGIVKNQANDLGDYTIDFTRKAIVSDDVYTANGNGVNKYEENGQDIYYFRGEIADNNVIWADKCWKVVRTTATGGTKMIYNGLPATVNGSQQCNATGVDSQIVVNVDGVDQNSFNFNNEQDSPADVGYMYGARLIRKTASGSGSTIFTFSNDVSRNGNTYTLDTSTGQSISGTWIDERANAASRYHYFCTDGATICDDTKIGYIIYFDNDQFGYNSIYYLNIGGYNDIEDAKNAMFANTTDSNAKAMVETWFEQQNLDGHVANTRNYEEDLEDTVFCNDRTYRSGSLKSKDSDASDGSPSHEATRRNSARNAENNLEPSLDCANNNDAFTKDSTNGNGKLKHKIGLITADELTLTGSGLFCYPGNSYLISGSGAWSASPNAYNVNNRRAVLFGWSSQMGYWYASGESGLRPVVSLKAGTEVASGSGLATDPYIIE